MYVDTKATWDLTEFVSISPALRDSVSWRGFGRSVGTLYPI